MVLPETLPLERPPEPPVRKRDARRWPVLALGVVVVVLLLRQVVGVLGGHSYEFLAMQGENPVTWNHCQAIRYQVNPKGAPDNWQELVTAAIDDVENASGFVFADKGTTVKTSLIGSRYDGNEWEPVLIVWSDRYQDQSLDGTIVGRGGGGTFDVNGVKRYVVGRVTLDATEKDPEVTRLVLEHELGHVLGLDHTSDSDQLMYARYHGQQGLGDGDIAGLKRLHDVPCD
jgi:hypothetical protein